MPRKLSKLKQVNTLLVTLLILFAPFSLYYLFYYSNQKSYFIDRNFRLLSVLGSGIEKKVDSVGTAYSKAADEADDSFYKPGPGCQPEETGKQKQQLTKSLGSLIDTQRIEGTSFQLAGDPEPVDSPSLPKSSNASSAVTLDLKQEDGARWLYFDYMGRPRRDCQPVAIHYKSKLVDFMQTFLQRFRDGKDFNSVFIADSEGGVLTQWAPEEIGLTNLGVLVGKDQNKVDFDRLKQNGNAADVVIADTNYKLFVQPVQFSLTKTNSQSDQAAKPDTQKDLNVKWVVGGLVRSDHLLAESTAISYTLLIVFTFLFFLVILTFPFLKLLFMGAKSVVRVADIYFLGFSILMGSALLTAFLIFAFTYTDLERTMDDQLEAFSNRIASNFETEIGSASQALKNLNEQSDVGLQIEELILLDKQVEDAVAQDKSGKPSDQETRGCDKTRKCLVKVNILNDQEKNVASYPYFNTAFWIDLKGQQRIKWTTRPTLTPFSDVSDRPYFKNILADRGWDFGTHGKLFLEPLYSRATSGQQVVLSMPMNSGWVSAMDIRPFSVLQTVLPRDLGYGYCVIDNEGKVLFHSDDSRNQVENFFRESDNDGYLRSVVLGGKKKLMDVHYLGADHRLFVRPLPHTPWSLVTFRDKQVLRIGALEFIAFAIYLFCFYALILLGLFILYYLSHREDRSALLWPYKRRAVNYYLSIGVNVILALLFILTIVTLKKPTVLIVISVLLPVIGFLFHHYNVTRSAEFKRCGNPIQKCVEKYTPLNYRRGYVLTLVTLLFLVSVLPMLEFFKLAYDREMKLFVELGEINLARGLEDRAERIQTQYSSLDPKGLPKNESVQEFIHKRLKLEPRDATGGNSVGSCDVYAEFFFGSRLDVDPRPFESGPEEEDVLVTFFERIIPFKSSTSLRVHGLTQGGMAATGLFHEVADNLILRTNTRVDGDEKHPTLQIESNSPLLGRARPWRWWIGLVAILLGILSFLFILIKFVGSRIFLLNTDEPILHYAEKLPAPLFQNQLVVASPFTCKDDLLTSDYEVLDFRTMKNRENWSHGYDPQAAWIETTKTIVINYFEHKREDVKTNRQKIRLLESLLALKKRVVVASAVDLAYYRFDETAKEPPDNGRDQSLITERAHAILRLFVPIYLEDRGDIDAFVTEICAYQDQWSRSHAGQKKEIKQMECLLQTLKRECQMRRHLQEVGRSILAESDFETLTPERVISRVHACCNPYYYAVWATCSKDEKLTLCNLATHQLMSSSNPTLPQLLRRGLIAKDPFLRPMSESFARFIAARATPARIEAWKGEQEGGAWDSLKFPFVITLIAVAAFLFVSQRELYNSTLALVSAFAAGMPALFKLLGLFTGAKSGGS
jgi:Cache domain